jgi:hypothetical protein
LGDNFRCGDIKASNELSYLITDYADWDVDPYVTHLTAFPATAKELFDSDVLSIQGGQCYFELEKSREKHLIVMVPNATVYVFTFGRGEGWRIQASIESKDIGGLNNCKNATLAAGYSHFYITVPSTRMLYDVDMTHVGHGELIVNSTKLDFTPGYMAVSAVPKGTGCALDFHDDPHDHDHKGHEDEQNKKQSSTSASLNRSNIQLIMIGAVAFIVAVI